MNISPVKQGISRYRSAYLQMFSQSHDASDKYPAMHNFVTEMCTRVHISVTKWCIVG